MEIKLKNKDITKATTIVNPLLRMGLFWLDRNMAYTKKPKEPTHKTVATKRNELAIFIISTPF